MRTKRKNYDDQSSDYGNENDGQEAYEEDDFDDDQEQEESDADSAYGESGNERGGGVHHGPEKAKQKKIRPTYEHAEEDEETYEDEDPFSPEIDQILADKQIDLTAEHPNTLKFENQSYVHVKWMTEKELEDYSYRAKQKIRRYWIQKQRKRAQQDLLQSQKINPKQRNHHFSDDEEEDEDEEAVLKGISLVDLPLPVEEPDIITVQKYRGLTVVDKSGEDLTQHFDKNYVIVERILSTSSIFPVIHPRQARQIRGKWQEDCLKIVNVMINFRKNNVTIGLSFADQQDPENPELANYFKVVKQPIDFVMIMNRLYNKYYQDPMHFWNELGLVFRNCRAYYKNTKLGYRKQCDSLRVLAYYLYCDWYNEQKTRFTTGIALPPEQPQVPISQVQLNPITPSGPGLAPISQQPSTKDGSQKDSTIVNLTSLLQGSTNPTQQNPAPVAPTQPNMGQPSVPQGPMNAQNQSVDFWNALTKTQNEQQQQNQFQMAQQAPPSNNFLPPNLPRLNQVMNPMQNPMANMQDPYQAQQNAIMAQMAAMGNTGMGGFNQFNPNMMNPQMQGFMNPQMMDPGQQNIDQNVMKQFFGQVGMPNMPGMGGDQSSLQLPSMNQFNQGMINNPYQQQNPMMGMNNPYGPGSMMEQMMQSQMGFGQKLNQSQMMGQPNPNDPFSQFGGQFNPGGMLPAISSMQNMSGSLQLPSFSQMGNQFGGMFNQNDPYAQMQQQMMLSMMGGQNPQNLLQQQQLLESLGLNGQNMGGNNLDEITMQMLRYQQQQQYGGMPGMPGMPPGMMGMDMSNFNMNDLMSMQGMMPPQMQQQYPQQPQQPQAITPTQQQVEGLIQGDNEVYNDKLEPPVAPAIIDPGNFDLSWLLDKGETLEDIQQSPYITKEDIDVAIKAKHFVDQLYLVKWRSLSYVSSTWEPESLIREVAEDKIQDYMKYNRSLDQVQRERLDQVIKNHKKMLRITEKKYQTGKKLDANQENIISTQESKLNKQLLSSKIQELMGNTFYQYIQYSEAKGLVPQFKKPQYKLKDYQIQGLNWLIRAWHEHRNVVLADEMGLGKTIMTLSLFDHIHKMYKLRGPFLILAPLTTLEHWKRIADEWTSLNAVLYYDPGSAEGRAEIRQWEWYFTDITYKGSITQKSELFKFNVIITSFEVFVQDLNPILQEVPFIYICVDEAHRLKNKQAKTLKLLKDHPCKRILLLTGTPVQNNTKELWTLLNYIEPEKFFSLDAFMSEFGNLENYEQITKLHQILKPHFLRRLKEEVDNSIPPLQETVIEVGLTNLQNAYYKGIYGENRMLLSKFGTNSIKTSQLNNIDVQLRKCCNHLFLLKGVEEELTQDCKNEEDLYMKLLDSSGKLMLLNKFIDKFRQENHKVLIFSQFKRMLEIIEWYLRMKGVPYEMLTGSVKTQDRISSIQRFNEEKTFGVFLLTTRAGGLGINLTSARVVIIFDSDWNPQNDLQAIARAHRIGQKFEVQVYRLITSKTYEEQMFERASKKLGMEHALFSKGAFNQNEDPDVANLSLRGITELKHDSKEIENLLKYGAYAFLDEEGNDQPDLNNKDIDEILATGKKKEFTYNKGVYTLQKSTFNASKYEKLPHLDDPEFWNKVLPFESLLSIAILEKRFKKEKKEMQHNDKMQKEFIKDLEIVFNDFMDAKFDSKTSNASKKQFESDEEKLREILKKIAKMNGFKLMYSEKCKEWLREMFRTNKRKKPTAKIAYEGEQEANVGGLEDEEEPDEQVQEDDIIMYDSDDDLENKVTLRKRTQKDRTGMQRGDQPSQRGKRGRKPRGRGGAMMSDRQVAASANKTPKQKVDSDYDDEYGAYGEEEGEEPGAVEGEEYDQEYGDEEQKGDEYGDEDDSDEPESRYGLRGRSKRQRVSKNANGQERGRHSVQKVNDFSKRNEKNGIVCSHCLRPEPPYCSWFCHGYCQRFFHEECKDALFLDGSKSNRNYTKDDWTCDDCKDNKAICFCCRHKSQILIIPKKGKPKAPGQPDGSIGLEELNQDILQDNDFDGEEGSDEYDDDDMENGDEEDQDEEPALAETNGDQQDESPVMGPEQVQLPKESPVKTEGGEGQSTSNEEIKATEGGELTQSPSKIVINTGVTVPIVSSEQNLEVSDQPKLQQTPSTKIVLNNLAFNKEEKPKTEEKEDKKYVVRCTLGGCFKYYHVRCVYKNKNVSCINSMKVQRFRCPLHYCEICQVSGDSVLIVQCVVCPTAYHLKCLNKDAKSIRLTKKYIICGKHNYSQDAFPKYEEKASYVQSTNSKQLLGGKQSLKDKRRNLKKKRGRKPKNYDDPNYESEGVHQSNTYQSQTVSNVEASASFIFNQKEGRTLQSQIGVKQAQGGQTVGQRGPGGQGANEVIRPIFQVTKHQRK